MKCVVTFRSGIFVTKINLIGDFRYGSNREVGAFNRQVGFTPNSGHRLAPHKLTLCAKKGGCASNCTNADELVIRLKCEHVHTSTSLGGAKSNIKSAQATLQPTECSMSDERWPYFAAIASIILAISVAYLVELKCQRELAFQRSFPSALSELIVGSEPIRCWFSN